LGHGSVRPVSARRAADDDAHHRRQTRTKFAGGMEALHEAETTMPSIGFRLRRRKHSRNEKSQL